MTITSNPIDGSPLAGIKVLEAANYVSGPFATLMLADLGAQVTKVEPPRGDPYRRFGPQDEHEAGGPMFRAVNRNKTSRLLDLKSQSGVVALHELLDGTDVLMSNWRPAVAAGFGLDPEQVAHRWPRLVWIRISGYGQDGPLADLPAFDSVMQARSGMLGTPADGEPPHLFPMYIVDKVTAMIAVQAALGGLVQRASTGRGTVADVAMLDAATYFNAPDIAAGHQYPDRADSRVARHVSAPRPLRTKDGAIVVSPVSGRQIKHALAAAGLEAHASRLKDIRDPTAMAETFYRDMSAVVATESTGYWLRRFAQADVPATAVLSVEDHMDDPQVIHNGIYRLAVDAAGRKVRLLRYPALFGGQPVGTADLPPPPLR